jgi:hypothetical protein
MKFIKHFENFSPNDFHNSIRDFLFDLKDGGYRYDVTSFNDGQTIVTVQSNNGSFDGVKDCIIHLSNYMIETGFDVKLTIYSISNISNMDFDVTLDEFERSNDINDLIPIKYKSNPWFDCKLTYLKLTFTKK